MTAGSAGDEPASLPGSITEDQLRDAIERSRSWRGVLRHFGWSSPLKGRQLQSAYDELGIGYDHFGTRTWSDGQLLLVVRDARCWQDMMTGLGYDEDSGSARATISKHLVRLGLNPSTLTAPPAAGLDDPFSAPADLIYLRSAGAFIVAGACAVAGYRVSWPLEPVVYDLLVDTGGGIHRVQVKTTTWSVDGTWGCKVTHSEESEKAWYTHHEIDYFGIVDGDRAVYMIPVDVGGSGHDLRAQVRAVPDAAAGILTTCTLTGFSRSAG